MDVIILPEMVATHPQAQSRAQILRPDGTMQPHPTWWVLDGWSVLRDAMAAAAGAPSGGGGSGAGGGTGQGGANGSRAGVHHGLEALPAGATLVAWSGGLGDALFEADPRTWGPAGWRALEAGLAALEPVLRARGQRLWLRPHARHVLSDPPACRRLASAWPEGPVGVLAEPMGMLTRSMLGLASEHLERSFGALAELAERTGLVLTNVEAPPGESAGAQGDLEPDAGPCLRRVGLTHGAIRPEVIAAAWRAHGPAACSVVLEAHTSAGDGPATSEPMSGGAGVGARRGRQGGAGAGGGGGRGGGEGGGEGVGPGLWRSLAAVRGGL
jgi:hypothetical protein